MTTCLQFVYHQDVQTYDTIYFSLRALLGHKQTGLTGTKEGSGAWQASLSRSGTLGPPTNIGTIYGTWDTNDQGGQTYYFDYTMCPSCPPNTPTYSLEWAVNASQSVSGGGYCQGQRTSYTP